MRAHNAVLVAALLAGASADAAPRTYALIVAENRSLDPNVAPLRYADDDGVRNFELFSLFADRTALFAVLDDDTARLHPEGARRAEVPERAAILARLAEWNREMEADLARGDEPELFFIYAGHGDVDGAGMGYVSLHDARLTRADLFRAIVAPSKARFIHLIIDACKSYFLVNARGGAWRDDRAAESRDDSLKAFLADEAGVSEGRYPRVGVIVATSGEQETHEWSRWRGGILSHELRSALRGAADVNGDGRVEYSEVSAFIAAANSRVRNPEARLDIYAHAPQLDRHRPLVDLRRAEAHGARLLHFADGERGQYEIEDDRGLRVADLNKEASASFDVALDPARGVFIRHGDEEAEVAVGARSLRSRTISVADLHFRRRALASRGALESSFRRDLFGTPFGRAFYDGYVSTSGDLPVEGEAAPVLVEALSPRPKNALSAGYLVSGAPLSVPGLMHAVDLRYTRRIGSWFELGLALQLGHGAGGAQEVTRVGALATVGGEYRPVTSLGLRLDLAAGYQYARGNLQLAGAGLVAGDAGGARIEIGGGLVYDFVASFGIALRGGLAIDIATIAVAAYSYRDTAANLSPFLDLAAVVRL